MGSGRPLAKPVDLLQAAFYALARFCLGVVFGIPHRLSVSGADRLPAKGAVVLAANHRHYLDPVFLAVAARRPVAYMAKAELFHVPVLGAVVKGLYAFPVHRGAGDRAALRAAAKVLARGRALGIFPEGTRQPGPGLGAPHAGAAVLALQAGAPIVPTAIVGTDRIGRPEGGRFAPVSVRFGEALMPDVDAADRRAEIDRLTDAMMDAIAREGGFER